MYHVFKIEFPVEFFKKEFLVDASTFILNEWMWQQSVINWSCGFLGVYLSGVDNRDVHEKRLDTKLKPYDAMNHQSSINTNTNLAHLSLNIHKLQLYLVISSNRS